MALAKYEVFEDRRGEYRWRLVAANGEVVSQSEAYSRKADAQRGLEDAKEASAEADLEAKEG